MRGDFEPTGLASATSLDEAARLVMAALSTEAPAGIWVTEEGVRRRLAADGSRAGPPDEDLVSVTCGSGMTIEAAGTTVGAYAAAVALAAVADRLHAQAQAETSQRQLAATEELGGLGSYDWDMAGGRLSWSDELFRIYGEDPEGHTPTYDGFLARVHPEDRERILAVHEEALRTGAPFETEERIVRADGAERTLLTNGMVVTDEAGRPVRLHGVCRDVTDERAARDDARRSALWFETLVEASPDAIVVVDHDGRITSVNPQAERLFGHDAGRLVGMSVDDLLPEEVSDRHAALRGRFARNPTSRPMAAGTDLEARRADGTLVAVDIALAPLGDDTDGRVAAFVRDATLRRQAEHDRRRVAEADLRRRQALELNDNVVQGLVALLWELEEGTVSGGARRSAERTLTAARNMMSDLLEDLPEDHETLVRTSQLTEHTPPSIPVPRAAPTDAGTIRVAIADDAADLRMLLRLRLQRLDDVEVVGEAEDGRQAVDLCAEHEPDLMLLDLSMPVLGGLQAAEQIRLQAPSTRIFVLSGYPADTMRSRALSAGADAYFEKSSDLDEVCRAVAALTRAPDGGGG